MKKMPSIWLDSLSSFDDVLKQIEKCLVILKDNASKVDFAETDNRNQYSNDVMYMKQLFERAEYLIRNGDPNGKKTKKGKRKSKAQHIDTGLDREDSE
jgi:hypothetical protein